MNSTRFIQNELTPICRDGWIGIKYKGVSYEVYQKYHDFNVRNGNGKRTTCQCKKCMSQEM